MSQSTELNAVNEIWNWAKILINLQKSDDISEQQMSLIKSCKEDLPSDFSVEEYCFPSKISEKFANQYINFTPLGTKKFKFTDILNNIWDNQNSINNGSINALLIMLIDVALYRAFTIISNLSHGRFLYQLNMCVILDTMIIEPDKNIGFNMDIVSILTEVSEKAKLRIDNLNADILWTLAMLNYKVHLYDYSITFFEKYINKNLENKDNRIQSRIIHAKIYIGYCYEKSEDFNKAIELFEKTLLEIASGDKTNDDNNKLIRELNHGLGHFYNERAVFAQPKDPSDDILNARYHMFDALSEKVDYYSCYGSLFHEYGDYQTAQNIFDEASQNDDILVNNELLNELQFYIAQTAASMATDEDNQVEQKFKRFEDYCEKTFNYDGIVHARIFKIRTFLRKIFFSSNNVARRSQIIKNIEAWYKELTEYPLSSYASQSIKTEYDKVLCILNIFKSLYSDTYFEWHDEDLYFNLQKLIKLMKRMKLMPEDVIRLGYIPKTISSEESNLYQIALGDLRVWCVGSNLLSDEQFMEFLTYFGTQTNAIIPVLDKYSAHVSIHGNGKPDLVILIPPSKKDRGFEQEVEAIKSSVSELYFVYSSDSVGYYKNEWFDKNIRSQGKKYTCYSAHNITDALIHAYCFRTFEILRKALLQPIPLFSLAPTHFSASYDFQLGETLEICFDSINEHNDDSKNLRELLSFIDDKYSKHLLNKMTSIANEFIGMNVCTPGIMYVCCPAPLSWDGVDNYIGYYINDSTAVQNLGISHGIKTGDYYTVKALPSYREVFWDLEKALRSHGNSCEQDQGDICTVFNGNSLLSNEGSDNIAMFCRNILSAIFNKNIEQYSEINKPFKCIVKKVEDADIQRQCYIYIILLKCLDSSTAEKKDKLYCPLKEDIGMKKDAPTVFVTYSWEKPDNPNDQNTYLSEVLNFVKKLRQNGYDATLDLDMYKDTHNWTDIMIQGLQKEKIIVLLSKEYKRKADDRQKNSGVKFESNALVSRFNRDPKNIILAKLPSQHSVSRDELLPICFSGENVIDLASTEMTDGYNQLWLTLGNTPVGGDMPSVNSEITKGRTL